ISRKIQITFIKRTSLSDKMNRNNNKVAVDMCVIVVVALIGNFGTLGIDESIEAPEVCKGGNQIPNAMPIEITSRDNKAIYNGSEINDINNDNNGIHGHHGDHDNKSGDIYAGKAKLAAAMKQLFGFNQRVHSATEDQTIQESSIQAQESTDHNKRMAQSHTVNIGKLKSRRQQSHGHTMNGKRGVSDWASGTLRQMANARELSASLSLSDLKAANLTSAMSKKAQRAKQLILQSVAKHHKTTDEIFKMHQENFCRQHAHAIRLHKEINNYAASLQTTLEASKSLNACLRDVNAGKEWTRHDLFCETSAQIEKTYENLIDAIVGYDNNDNDFDDNTEQREHIDDECALDLVEQYTQKFTGVKERISKRARKLIDYDAARRAFAQAQAAHNKRLATATAASTGASENASIESQASVAAAVCDNSKLDKQKEAYEQAKRAYQSLNEELNEELPQLYASRVSHVLALIERLCHAHCEFHSRNQRLYSACGEALETLSTGVPLSVPTPGFQEIQTSNSNNNRTPINGGESANRLSQSRPQQVTQQHTTVASNEDQAKKCTGSGASECSSGGGAASSFDSDEDEDDDRAHDHEDDEDDRDNDHAVTEDHDSGLDNNSAGQNSDKSADETSSAEAVFVETKQTARGAKQQPQSSSDTVVATQQVPQQKTQIPKEATTVDLPDGVLYRVKTSYKYLAEDEDELSFEADEILQVIEYEDPLEREDGWLMGVRELNSAKGLFPANFTRPV
ncbi:Bridging integrator 2, partial [Fragariocoptes setiger]